MCFWTFYVFPNFFSLFVCFGMIYIFSTMILVHLFNKYIFCLLYNLFCDKPISFYLIFLFQFSCSESFIIFRLFLSNDWPCCNFWKCNFYSLIIVFVFSCNFVNWEINCENKKQKLLFMGCGYIWSFRQIVQRFLMIILTLFVTHSQLRFYIPIY